MGPVVIQVHIRSVKGNHFCQLMLFFLLLTIILFLVLFFRLVLHIPIFHPEFFLLIRDNHLQMVRHIRVLIHNFREFVTPNSQNLGSLNSYRKILPLLEFEDLQISDKLSS